MLIAIDGPAGAGKSTVARGVASKLGFTYLDTGAMYRCVALAALEQEGQSSAGTPGGLGQLAASLRIAFGDAHNAQGRHVLLDGRDVSEAIRAPEVSQMASRVAAEAGVRTAMVDAQRRLIATGDWVAEGRDIGTVVAPEAELKVFLTASPEERARRRAAELKVDPRAVLAEQALRDERDSTREHSPLKAAAGATVLDTTGLYLDLVIDRIVELARGLQ